MLVIPIGIGNFEDKFFAKIAIDSPGNPFRKTLWQSGYSHYLKKNGPVKVDDFP